MVILFVISESVPCVHHEALGAVLAVLADFVVLEDTEGLIDAALTTDIFRVKDVTHILGIQSIQMPDDRVYFSLKKGATFWIICEWLFLAKLRQSALLMLG